MIPLWFNHRSNPIRLRYDHSTTYIMTERLPVVGCCTAAQTSCAGSRAICPAPVRRTLQPIHALRLRRQARTAPRIFMIDRQRLALGGGVETGGIHINYVVTWTANQSGLVTLTFDFESGVRVMCDVGYLCANFSLPRPFCSRVRPDVRDRQTDVRQKHRLVPPPIREGHLKKK